jgi:hypothetical protein
MLPQQANGAKQPSSGRVRAAILPHAGYVFSGAIAARTLALAQGFPYKRALVLAPSHRVAFEGLACAPYNVFRTPLGDIPVDGDALETLKASGSELVGELLQAHAKEHSLEVELPLLQELLPPMPIVPLVAGQLDVAAAQALADVLLPLWNPETLWIISSDFTHYGKAFDYMPFPEAKAKDGLRALDLAAADRIASLDLIGFSEYIKRTGATICGESPIKILLAEAALAKAGGAKLSCELACYANSGELTNDWSHCVGYAGMVLRENA